MLRPFTQPKTAKPKASTTSVTAAGKGPYQPKQLELVTSTVHPNPIQEAQKSILDSLKTTKNSVDNHMNRVEGMLQRAKDLNVGDAVKLQWELTMFSVETTLVSKTEEKISQCIKTLCRPA